VAFSFIALRLPFKSNFFTHTFLPAVNPMNTLPTGDLFVPPVGPGILVLTEKHPHVKMYHENRKW
jgi:hypothetical protein